MNPLDHWNAPLVAGAEEIALAEKNVGFLFLVGLFALHRGSPSVRSWAAPPSATPIAGSESLVEQYQ
jgi:hypothetical protein